MLASPALAGNAANLRNGAQGALMGDVLATGFECDYGHIRYRNMQTGRSVDVAFDNARGWLKTKYPRYTMVQPGLYQPVSGVCVNDTGMGKLNQRFTDIGNHFGPVGVGPGEVVYPGTYSLTAMAPRSLDYRLVNRAPMQHDLLVRKRPKIAPHMVVRPVPAKPKGYAQPMRPYPRIMR